MTCDCTSPAQFPKAGGSNPERFGCIPISTAKTAQDNKHGRVLHALHDSSR